VQTAELRPYDTIQWVSVLRSLTAYQMYRRSEQIRVQRPAVLRFLFQSPEFPRSVLHCVDAVRASLEGLPRNDSALRVAGRLKRNVAEIKLARLSQAELHAFVDELQGDIANLHREITATWFPPPAAEASETAPVSATGANRIESARPEADPRA